MTQGVFISGTDTGVGKTMVSVALLRALVAEGYATIGMKPVAAGLPIGDPVNADVRALMAAGNRVAPLADINPYCFAPPIAPHLAAFAIGSEINLERIAAAYARLAAVADAIVVEGAGGLLVPLGSKTDMLDVAVRLGLPVVLVVGIRLGCLNHALLSALALEVRGVRFAGWVANRSDATMPEGEANVATLLARLNAPLLADIAWSAGGAPVTEFDRTTFKLLGFAR